MKRRKNRSHLRPVLLGLAVMVFLVSLAGLIKIFYLDGVPTITVFGKKETSIPVNANPNPSSKPDAPKKPPLEWSLIVANPETPIPKDYSVKVRSLPNGLEFDERAYDNLMAMLDDGRTEGLSFVVCSAYRSLELQKNLYEAQVAKQKNKGLSQAEAEKAAKTIVAFPGTSEHQLGLAADIVALNYQTLDNGYADTPEAKWLKENAHKYGFILRYPAHKEDITKIVFEPWHFRYVGIEHAQEIKRLDLCLEEYVSLIAQKS